MAESYVPTAAEREKLARTYEAQKQQRQENEGAKKAAAGETGSRGEMKKAYKKGGYVRSADGIAQRGKTKGRMI